MSNLTEATSESKFTPPKPTYNEVSGGGGGGGVHSEPQWDFLSIAALSGIQKS